MKKILMMVGTTAIALVACAEISLDEAVGQIVEAVENPAKVEAVMKDLAPSNQVAYVAALNNAIRTYGCSNDEKGEKFVVANRGAMTGADKSVRNAVLAEIFATVSPEGLTAVNESFAKDFYNRETSKMSESEYASVAGKVMDQIQARAKTAEHAEVRDVFGALMFANGAGGNKELAQKLVDGVEMPSDVKDVAKNEWIPAALGVEQEKTYAPMLAYANAGDPPVVLNLGGAEKGLSMMADMMGARDGNGMYRTDFQNIDALGGYKSGDIARDRIGDQRQLSREPKPYQWQQL